MTSESTQDNSGLIKSLADRGLALSASAAVAGYWVGRVSQPHDFPAFLSLIKDNKQSGTGSLLGNEGPGVQKQDGNWLWENVLIMTSRGGRPLKVGSCLAKTRAQGMMGIHGALAGFPENKACLAREKGKDKSQSRTCVIVCFSSLVLLGAVCTVASTSLWPALSFL